MSLMKDTHSSEYGEYIATTIIKKIMRCNCGSLNFFFVYFFKLIIFIKSSHILI